MGFTAAGISPSTVTTTQQCPLGFELTVPNGDKGFQTWVYVKSAAADINHGDVCMINANATPYEVKETTGQIGMKCVGVAQHLIANGSYGFILRRGRADYIHTGGSVGAGDALMSAASGAAATATLSTAAHIASIIGYAEAADADTTVAGVTRMTCAGVISCHPL
tara:strand:- start:288 stop:782 length:495 start_codon:yes stop_codon:yes gene_type:complete